MVPPEDPGVGGAKVFPETNKGIKGKVDWA
jgi:hypothetical protein